MHEKIWYKQPARDWLEGLPIGTGRLAAMVLGSYKRERIALNHEWLWKGTNRNRDNRKVSDRLSSVRELLLAGNYREGTLAGDRAFGSFSDTPPSNGPKNRVDPYQPAGDLYIELNHGPVSDYYRELDLSTAISSVRYTSDRRRFQRSYMAHLTQDVIFVRYSAGSQPFDVRFWIDRNHDPDCTLSWNVGAGRISMAGSIEGGISFQVQARYWCDGGKLRLEDEKYVTVDGTNELIVGVNIGTSATGRDPAEECGLILGDAYPDWEKLEADQKREHGTHYGSVALEIPLEEPETPTDARMQALREGREDPGLVLTYFNYGRYLLCASSANAMLPANLQGKWNEDLSPPWQCDYHHDINLQMNYWIAEPAGMQNYAEALIQHIERFVPHGKRAAIDLYGCRGVWFPIQSDAWGRATPESYGYAVWIGAAPWLAQHIWWHWEYGRDLKYLRERAYPFLREVAAFYEDYLIEDEDGNLQIVPSQSPENRFVESGPDAPVSLGVSSAMDLELARESITHTLHASQILNIDSDMHQTWQSILDRLPGLKLGSKGQLLEWDRELEEQEPGHRHISHLVGFFPGEQIHPDRTPDLFAGAIRSLEIRLANAGGHTGWSRAWTACCFARAGDGDRAFEHLEHLITDFATDTLLDLHPPRIFQIDGNLGGAAAVMETLLQSYYEELDFLPALPSAWPDGSVRGLRARGGYIVDIDWTSGKLARANITAVEDRTCKIRHRDQRYVMKNREGEVVKAREHETVLEFSVIAGIGYEITMG